MGQVPGGVEPAAPAVIQIKAGVVPEGLRHLQKAVIHFGILPGALHNRLDQRVVLGDGGGNPGEIQVNLIQNLCQLGQGVGCLLLGLAGHLQAKDLQEQGRADEEGDERGGQEGGEEPVSEGGKKEALHGVSLLSR